MRVTSIRLNTHYSLLKMKTNVLIVTIVIAVVVADITIKRAKHGQMFEKRGRTARRFKTVLLSWNWLVQKFFDNSALSCRCYQHVQDLRMEIMRQDVSGSLNRYLKKDE